ncbi:hypothetical protein EVAR_87300_1 [Eumeta japonica]|uniref:Caspase-8 n=1 Tax=Eumeta variegata TaxID=151549 RepID=A0A4C1VWG9_EUMVA|nr:hypothetical protein EVAR_87300_1 [Eumeta japonica]
MNSVISNIDAIDINAVAELQHCLDLSDITSLVFLLYDAPHTALERLTLLHRVSEVHSRNMDLLCDWARLSQTRNSWKYELLEALSICQLFGAIKKLGFNVDEVKRHFLPHNVHVTHYINPMKKLLYKICENIQMENLLKLKKTLVTFDIDVQEYETCELIFLKLIVEEFIMIGSWKTECKIQEQCNMKNLTNIFRNLQGLMKFALELQEAENYLNNGPKPLDVTAKVVEPQKLKLNHTNYIDFKQIDELFQNLSINEELNESSLKLKSDSSKLHQESYPIIKKSRLGICYIINQEEFYSSKESIAKNIKQPEDRKGTEKDEIKLSKIMKLYNFEVVVDRNLNHQQIPRKIKDVIKNDVLEEDSIFIFCILSHGIEGCVFGADSVPVPIKTIWDILDSDAASKLHGKPKVLIIQACQESHQPRSEFVADGLDKPFHSLTYTPKSDFLTYWATAPELSAYRCEKEGSIFIQMLCFRVHQLGKEEQLCDIFTKVNEDVIVISKSSNYIQVPSVTSTLRRKLYLHLPV